MQEKETIKSANIVRKYHFDALTTKYIQVPQHIASTTAMLILVPGHLTKSRWSEKRQDTIK